MTCQVVENEGRNQMADLVHLEGPGLLRCHCRVLCLALWRKLSGRMDSSTDLNSHFYRHTAGTKSGLKSIFFFGKVHLFLEYVKTLSVSRREKRSSMQI